MPAYFVDSEGIITDEIYTSSFLRRDYLKTLLDINFKALHIYALYDRDMLKKSDLSMLNNKNIGTDQAFVSHLVSLGNIRTINCVRHRYRIHDANISSGTFELDFEYLFYIFSPASFYF